MKRKLVLFCIFVFGLGAVYLWFRPYLTLNALILHEAQLRALTSQYPLISILVGFLVYVVLSLIPGTTGKSLVYGWLFGFWCAVVQVNIALTFAAVVTFLFSRYMFRDAIQSRFGVYLSWLNRTMRNDGAYLLMTLRVAHAPYSFVNYSFGATPMPTKTFWWASQIGLIPGNVLFVYAGSNLPTLQAVAEDGLRTLITPQLVVSFILLACIPFVARWLIRRLSRQTRQLHAEKQH